MNTILYVDDEKLNLFVFGSTFKGEFEVVTAENGQEAIDIIENNQKVDFVISDFKMPEMNGMKLINEIKRIRPSMPCMLLSGFEKTEEVNVALKNGLLVNYMMKPFQKEKIIEIVRSCV